MSDTDLRPILGVMLWISLAVFIICTVLYFLSYKRKSPLDRELDRFETVAIVIGIIATLAWTIILWPVMTGSSKGAYVVYVNGVASGGGLVDIIYGFVPLFVCAVALIALPRALGYGFYKMGETKRAGKRSVPRLVFSILGVIFGVIWLGMDATMLANGQATVIEGVIIIAVVGAIALILGIRGIMNYVKAEK